jgi:hypothetical protein
MILKIYFITQTYHFLNYYQHLIINQHINYKFMDMNLYRMIYKIVEDKSK